MDFLLIHNILWMIAFFIISAFAIYTSSKDKKQIRQLQADYDSLMEIVKTLTHENNILKNSNADTK